MTETRRVILLGLLSAALCAGLSASQCFDVQVGECPIGAIAALSGSTSYADASEALWLWLHWVNWLPGIIFGVLFSVARGSRAPRSLSYGLLSGAAYLLAGLTFNAMLSSLDAASGHAAFMAGGALAGLLGSGMLAFGWRFISRDALTRRAAARTVALGAVLGIAFIYLCFWGTILFERLAVIPWFVGFAIWQIPVAVSLTRLPAPNPLTARSASAP